MFKVTNNIAVARYITNLQSYNSNQSPERNMAMTCVTGSLHLQLEWKNIILQTVSEYGTGSETASSRESLSPYPEKLHQEGVKSPYNKYIYVSELPHPPPHPPLDCFPVFGVRVCV